MTVELVPASGFSTAALAALFTASFEGYVVPMTVDEAIFRRMLELFDFDLGCSRVALRDGRPVGLVNLGVRGRGGWVGGMGVVPDERRRGTGELLMRSAHDAARERGLDHVVLEVIDTNRAAIALYEKLGYERLRDLEIWSLDADPPRSTAREAPPAEAHARVRELRDAPEPWQRSDVVLERLLVTEQLRGLVADGGAAVVRPTPHAVVVEQVAARDAEAARELLAAALAIAGPVRLTNVPAGAPVAQAFSSLGGKLDLRQHELRLEL